MSDQTGFGYFRNFGETRRKGFDLSASRQLGRFTVGTGYTFLAATYESEETVNGESNSSNDRAEDGAPGLEGAIEIDPGDRIPLIPRHQFKAYAEVQLSSNASLDIDLVAVSSAYARGNENNRHQADGTYYLGPGSSPGYSVVNLGATYRLRPWMQIVAQITNLFDRRYYTAAQLGALGFTNTGAFVARPFPAVGGEFPLRHATFYAPGAPIRMWIGTRFRF